MNWWEVTKYRVEECNEYWKKEYFLKPEKILERLFQEYGNEDFDEVFIKCTMLNSVYNTNLYNSEIIELSKWIVKNAGKVDKVLTKNQLIEEDLRIVDEMTKYQDNMKNDMNRRKNNPFSFTSKYFSFSRPNDFPIYDSFVEKMLWIYQKNGVISKYNRSDLTSKTKKESRYVFFKDRIDELMKQSKVTNLSYKDLDHFLWFQGKRYSLYLEYIKLIDNFLIGKLSRGNFIKKIDKFFNANGNEMYILEKDLGKKLLSLHKMIVDDSSDRKCVEKHKEELNNLIHSENFS